MLACLVAGPEVLDYESIETISILKYFESPVSGPTQVEERLVYGIVLRPDYVDAHLDIMSIKEVQKTAHRYLANGGTMGLMHEGKADAVCVESYIAPVDFAFGSGEVKRGDWMLVSQIISDELWGRIKSGELKSFSPGGWSRARILV